jgi:hypothetical protein
MHARPVVDVKPHAADHAQAALAYALWDSENSIRMRADCLQEHLARASEVIRWLRIHGCEVVPIAKPSI